MPNVKNATLIDYHERRAEMSCFCLTALLCTEASQRNASRVSTVGSSNSYFEIIGIHTWNSFAFLLYL